MLRQYLRYLTVVTLVATVTFTGFLLIDFLSSFIVCCLAGNDNISNYTECAYNYYRSLHRGLIASGFDLIGRFGPEVWTAIATFVVAGFTFTLWRTTDRLWKSSEKQIGIAQKTATAALRQANAMVAIESPVLVIGQVKFVAYPDAYDPQSTVDPVLEGEIPAFCRALVGLNNSGRSNATITRLCLEWRILPMLPVTAMYEDYHIQPMNLLFGPNPNLITFFGLEHPANPVVLTVTQRIQIRDGQSLWVYGFFTYRNFMNESFDLGFVTRWNPPYGLVAETHQNYAYHRQSPMA